MKGTKAILLLILLILLAGCWDERQLKEVRTVYLSGFDVGENDGFTLSVVIRNLNISESSRGDISAATEMITGHGRSIRETSLNVDQAVAGIFDPAKGRTIILGEEAARNDIYEIFDSIFREPRVNLNMKVVMTPGEAQTLIQKLTEEEIEKAEYFYEMILSREELTEVPSETAQTMLTHIHDEGKDFFLPYLEIDEEDQIIKVMGSALFDGSHFTGQYLSIEESTLLLILMDNAAKTAVLTNDINEDTQQAISYNVKKVSRDLQITKEENVHVTLPLHLEVEILDYAAADLDTPEKIHELNDQLSRLLTEEAEQLMDILADSNSDILGIGRELIAYHPAIWEEIKGEDYYQHITIEPQIEVTIIERGVIL